MELSEEEELTTAEQICLMIAYTGESIWIYLDAPEFLLEGLRLKGYLQIGIGSYPLTVEGIKYIEVLSPERVVSLWLKMFTHFNGLGLPNRGVIPHVVNKEKLQKLASKFTLESLPELLVHEDSRIRELARERFEELKKEGLS